MSRLVNRHRETGKYYYLGSEQDMLAKMYDLEESIEPHKLIHIESDEFNGDSYLCSKCKSDLSELHLHYSFCPRCGQKFTWD